MTLDRIWTEADFDDMSWHDNHVHGLRVVAGEYGAGKLILDLDYITEWCKGEEEGFRFRIVPAELMFKDVTNLRVRVDYATPTAALGPFSLASIEREQQPRERYTAQFWKILINWPVGEIEFEASGFEQRGTGASRLSKEQWLAPAQRETYRQED